MSDVPQQSMCRLLRPQEEALRAPGSGGSRTPRNEAITGLGLALAGFVASLNPGDLLVTLPFLLAGLYVSGASLRAAGDEVALRWMAIAGIAVAILGLVTTAVLFVIFIG